MELIVNWIDLVAVAFRIAMRRRIERLAPLSAYFLRMTSRYARVYVQTQGNVTIKASIATLNI